MTPSQVKSRPATRSKTCLPGSLAPVIQRLPAHHAGVDEEADRRLALAAQHLRTDVALDQDRVLVEVGERLDLGGRDLRLQPLGVDLAVAGDADDQRLPRAVGVHQRDDDVLQRGRRGVAGVREQLLGDGDQGLDRRGVGGVLDVRLGEPVERDLVRDDGGDGLDVGRVPAGRADEGVLADRRRVQELLALGAAHRAGHRRDDHVLQAQPVEDLDVGVAVRGVGAVQPRVVHVEGVAVLHRELAAAEQPGAGPRLVPELGLDLVQRERQVLVGGVQVLHQEREHLLVRGAEQEVVAPAVLAAGRGWRRTRSSGRSPRRAPAAAARGSAPPARPSRPSPRGRCARRCGRRGSPAAAR